MPRRRVVVGARHAFVRAPSVAFLHRARQRRALPRRDSAAAGVPRPADDAGRAAGHGSPPVRGAGDEPPAGRVPEHRHATGVQRAAGRGRADAGATSAWAGAPWPRDAVAAGAGDPDRAAQPRRPTAAAP